MKRYACSSKPSATWVTHRAEITKDSSEFSGIVIEALYQLGYRYFSIFECVDAISINCNTIISKLDDLHATTCLMNILKNSASKRNCIAEFKSWLSKFISATF